jgi:putative N6-adenine-specific DNA methylase
MMVYKPQRNSAGITNAWRTGCEQGVRMVKGHGFMYKEFVLVLALKKSKTNGLLRQITNSSQRLCHRVKRQSTLVIDVTVHSENFTTLFLVSQKCKDAIVDQFRERTGVNAQALIKNVLNFC